METNPLKTQVGGSHYNELKIQPAEYTHANKLGHMAGDAIAYITRYKSKGGRQDLEKAIHCLQILIALDYPETPEATPAPTYAIDWSKVPEDCDWVAMDSNEEIFAYLKRPKRLDEGFWIEPDHYKKVGYNSTLDWFPPGTDWRETLTKRP